MAVTHKLGTLDSQLGNILLGSSDSASIATTTDAPTLSESVTHNLSTARTTTDAPMLSESAAVIAITGKVATDNPTLSESAVVVTIQDRTTDDASTLSESVEAIVAIVALATDAPTLSEDVQRVGNFNRTTTDSPTISESIDWVAILDRTTDETVTFSEEATATRIFIVTGTDAPTLSESVSRLVEIGRTTTDTPTLSENLTTQKILFKSVSQSLTITHSNLVNTPIQNVEQGLVLNQSVDVTTELSKSASSTLFFSQSADYLQFKPTEVESTLDDLDHSVDVVKTKGFVSELTITQDVAIQLDPHFDFGNQGLEPEQEVTVAAIFNRTIEQTLTLDQSIVSLKIKPVEASNTLTILQQVLGGPLRNASNTLDDLDHDVVVDVFRNKSVSQSLAITQSVGLQMILNRSLTSTLVFKDEHPVPNGSGGFIQVPNLIYTKGGSTLANPSCVCPVASATTVLQSGGRAIVLPNPEYNDTEGLVAAVSIKRTITGDTYSYVKKSNNRKLKYKFLIDQRKAYELRRFLLDFLGNRITMTNWKGEMWSGFILNDPVEIISHSRGGVCTGDLYEVDLEYQGVRIN